MKEKELKNIGNRIRNIRKEKGFTLDELSQIANISVSFLSDVENNKNMPTLTKINSIAQALNMKISTLIGEDNTPKYTDPELINFCRELGQNKKITELFQIVNELTPNTIDRLTEYAVFLQERNKYHEALSIINHIIKELYPTYTIKRHYIPGSNKIYNNQYMLDFYINELNLGIDLGFNPNFSSRFKTSRNIKNGIIKLCEKNNIKLVTYNYDKDPKSEKIKKLIENAK